MTYSNKCITVEPIYGYGWIKNTGDLLDTPKSFELEVINCTRNENYPRLIIGKCRTAGNLLFGFLLMLEYRGEVGDAYDFNLFALDGNNEIVSLVDESQFKKDPMVTGFVKIQKKFWG